MIRDHQDRMAHCHLSFLLAAASSKAVVLRAQIPIFSVRGAVCSFNQAVAQPRTAFARAAGTPLSCRLVVSGTHPPAHDAKWRALAKRAMSPPVSAHNTSA